MILSELFLKQQKHVTSVCYTYFEPKAEFYSTNLTKKLFESHSLTRQKSAVVLSLSNLRLHIVRINSS